MRGCHVCHLVIAFSLSLISTHVSAAAEDKRRQIQRGRVRHHIRGVRSKGQAVGQPIGDARSDSNARRLQGQRHLAVGDGDSDRGRVRLLRTAKFFVGWCFLVHSLRSDAQFSFTYFVSNVA